MPPSSASLSVTTGLKCAPDIGPNANINATSAAPVAIVFARSAIATFPPASRSPMMPEPITVARRRAVPSASATARRGKSTAAAAAIAVNLRYTARRLAQALLLGDSRIRLHEEHLPCVAVRVLDPDFVLQRVAAFGVVFGERLEASFFEARPRLG